MSDSIAHRGPDDEGVWIDQSGSVGLAHRRLSIIDLSPHGHQPMISSHDRYVITYNGEIYNHLELRAELEQGGNAPIWRGNSDTETLLECIQVWGLQKALQKSAGMFALAVWDRRERSLFLARDRFGEKPLYYGWVGADFVFSSELKAIRRHPQFDNAIDRGALQLLAARSYIPAPFSIYQHIYKLEPGCILTVKAGSHRSRPGAPPTAGARGDGVAVERYWSYREVVAAGLDEPFDNEGEALEALDAALSQAVRKQSVADVPIGAFLSGGIDSSVIVALYQKHSSNTVKTFTIGFDEEKYNEAHHARGIAGFLGTEHHDRYVTFREAQSVIPLIPRMYDEPFADSSQIPTFLVSKFAREQVTVAMSGDGGDELFGGYARHTMAPKLWSQISKVPASLRMPFGKALGKLPPGLWTNFSSPLPRARRPPFIGSKVRKGLAVLGTARSLDDLYATMLDEWSTEASPVLRSSANPFACALPLDVGRPAPDSVRLMYCDAVTYLPDDILCKVDRAAMAVSLETRVPFLDHRVAEVAARTPAHMKINGSQGKMILRKLLQREVPKELFDRPKAGFALPVGEWIKGPLRAWAEELLDPASLSAGGFFSPKPIRLRWKMHLAGERDASQSLWTVLMFQAWLKENSG